MKPPCGVCGTRENVARSVVWGLICGTCLLNVVIPTFYGGKA